MGIKELYSNVFRYKHFGFWVLPFLGNENDFAFLLVRELNYIEENINIGWNIFFFFFGDFLRVESSPKSSPVILRHIKWELSYFKIM